MSMWQPLEPSLPQRDDGIPAADSGAGAPELAEGFEVGGEEPDVSSDQEDPAEASAAQNPPFPTPDPTEISRNRAR